MYISRFDLGQNHGFLDSELFSIGLTCLGNLNSIQILCFGFGISTKNQRYTEDTDQDHKTTWTNMPQNELVKDISGAL